MAPGTHLPFNARLLFSLCGRVALQGVATARYSTPHNAAGQVCVTAVRRVAV